MQLSRLRVDTNITWSGRIPTIISHTIQQHTPSLGINTGCICKSSPPLISIPSHCNAKQQTQHSIDTIQL
jgi:hypothetical protein